MWTKRFWKDTTERAIKSFAQSAVTLIGADVINVVNLDWQFVTGASVTVALVSVLTSLASYKAAGENASLVLGDEPQH